MFSKPPRVLGTNDFKASNGWLYKFKERHGFVMSSKAAQSSMGIGAPAPSHPLSTHSHSAPPSMTAPQHSPPGPPMVPPNACLPSEYPPPASIAAVVPHPGMQQRGAPSLASAMPPHQQLGSLGPSPIHLSGHMAPPPPPPHTPRDLVTPPPLGSSQQIPSLGPSPFLPPPPQHISPPPAVQTPGKPSPDYELANYHQALNDYDPSRIYTVSETCLLFNKLPLSERDTFSDTLNAESRITVLLCANADGSQKLRPLVINSRRDGEDFNENRDKLPVSYETQRSSFLTGKIFQQWIWELERRVDYPCVLLLDTSPAHVSVSVQSDKIKLLFLQNSLRQLQPLNQGAMTEFKARYKAEMISHIEQNYKQLGQNSNCSGGNSNGVWNLTPPEAMLSFVDALYILNQAWKSLSRESLLESWTRSQLLSFRMYNGRKDIEEEAIHELSQVMKASKICCGESISNAQGAGSPVGGSELSRKEIVEFLHLDDSFPTSYSFSEEAFESSRAPQGYTNEAMDTALMQYYHLQRARQQTPEEILSMLDTMERFFTHQALISSTDILAIHSLRSKTYQIASNYYPPTSSMLSSASSLGVPPPVVSPPMSSTPHAHLSPHSQYTPPLLTGPPLVPHQQPPYPVSY
ncbi:uncharacterized protein LOC100907734 [Galendromus occidentalis]|uniref:Uncharacterized protein LOC100907734 n=1 Tax=Galendromus occidentalis TaxID=34638 RepID=A0AAJ7SHU9_9ACAR|nr:uncharacterized protein LOC100907734 [Galendromus occidentalis]